MPGYIRTRLMVSKGVKSKLVLESDDLDGYFEKGSEFTIIRLGNKDCDLQCPYTKKKISNVLLEQVEAYDKVEW